MLNIPQPGKTKQQLLEKLEVLKKDLLNKAEENEVTLSAIDGGYNLKAEKQVLFMTFFVDAKIIAKEGEYEITWKTNAPESKVAEALEKVKQALEK